MQTDAVSTKKIDTPVGTLTLQVSETALLAVSWGERHARNQADGRSLAAARVIDEAEAQLREYFAGARRAFDLPLLALGTPFQMRVWQALRAIPFGETRSYAALARAVGSPKAFRAVGAANRVNPHAIVVPCHRVIGADGALTGFAGGLSAKAALLELEQGAGARARG